MALPRPASIYLIIKGLFQIFSIRSKTAWAIFQYTITAVIISGVAIFAVYYYRETVTAFILNYSFPVEWHSTVKELGAYILEQQYRDVLANSMVNLALLTVSLFLFPLKEKISLSFELEKNLVAEKPSEHPLWYQAWEEIRLFVFFIAAQATIFWLGYHTHPYRKLAAQIFSYTVTFMIFTYEFIPPLLQRHKATYSKISRVFLTRPLLLFGFGAAFSMPLVLLTQKIIAIEGLSLAAMTGIVFGMNIIIIVIGLVSGTWVAAGLMPETRSSAKLPLGLRLITTALVIVALVFNGWVFSLLGKSMHAKTQILKMNYSIIEDSFSVRFPQIESPGSFLEGAKKAVDDQLVEVDVFFTLEIDNPTGIDTVIEDSDLLAEINDKEVATAELKRLEAKANTVTTSDIDFRTRIYLNNLSYKNIKNINRWKLTLIMHLDDGFDFPVYLVDYRDDNETNTEEQESQQSEKENKIIEKAVELGEEMLKL